ncbi:MAG: beta-galactosidase [Lachnotalea sp.]
MKNKQLMFGVAYYPEYMPYDRMKEDFAMMKKAGINTVRVAESTWSTLEPMDGKFDFTWIDKVLKEAELTDMSIIVGTPTYAVPSWLVQKDPDVLEISNRGREKYGHRQIMDLVNPTFRFHAERVIRELISHTAGNKQVIGFQIDNETKHYWNEGEEIQRLFRAYLKDKFKTPEILNKTFYLAYWSNSIHDWDQFPDINGCINGGLAGEFEKFQRQVASDYLHWQSDIIREYKTDEQFITHNLDFEWKKFGADIAQDGFSYGIQPGINHYEAAKCLTKLGADIYHPTQDDLTGAEIAFGGDSIRSLKYENYLVLECQAQAFKYWTPYPGQLRLQAYSHLASGADGISYWNWHSIHNSFETYWKGLLSHDLCENPAYEEACCFGKEWQELGEQLVHLEKKNEVALIIDNNSMTAFKWFPIDRDLSYSDVVRWMYDSLYEMNIECDVVDVNGLDPDRYKIIVVPALYCATEEMLRKLDSFVKKGGVLVSSFKSFVADEYFSVYPDKQPHILHDCFGMSYNQFTEPGKTTLKGTSLAYFAELLKLEGAESLADYEHKYWGKYAGITRNAYGKGKAYYIGCYTEKDVIKKIYEMAVLDANIRKKAMNYQWPVIIRSGRNQFGKQLHYLLNFSEKVQKIECAYESVKDLLSGKNFRKGNEILIKDWNLKILEEA